MIITRAPLRASIVGGGSDLPAYFEKGVGAVVSTAIDKYIYVTLNKKFDNGIRIGYSKNEEVGSIDEIEHKIVRESLKLVGLQGGIEITTIADIPSRGTGLGSSSTFTVALLHALNAYKGFDISPDDLACAACRVEIEKCGEPIGKQDQYISAFGGFRLIEFYPDNKVEVRSIICKPQTISNLESNTLVFYTGISRSACSILAKQAVRIRDDKLTLRTVERMVALAYACATELENDNVDSIGHILHEGWMLKRSLLSSISTEQIDHWYSLALRSGALGGKILGAGAGGFLLFYAPQSRHDAIKNALADLRPVPIKFVSSGSKVLFNNS